MTAGFGNDGIFRGATMLNVPPGDALGIRFAVQHHESDGFAENTGTGEDWNDGDSP